MLAAITGTIAHFATRSDAGPQESAAAVAAEFAAYLARHDMTSLRHVISRKSYSQLEPEGVETLVSNMVYWPERWKTRTATSRSAQKTIAVEPQYEPLNVACIREEGQWKVDLVATFGSLHHLSAVPRNSEIFRITGIDLNESMSALRKKEICAGNMHRIFEAMEMYAADFDERFPLATDWKTELHPYISNAKLLQCPCVDHQGYAFNWSEPPK